MMRARLATLAMLVALTGSMIAAPIAQADHTPVPATAESLLRLEPEADSVDLCGTGPKTIDSEWTYDVGHGAVPLENTEIYFDVSAPESVSASPDRSMVPVPIPPHEALTGMFETRGEVSVQMAADGDADCQWQELTIEAFAHKNGNIQSAVAEASILVNAPS